MKNLWRSVTEGIKTERTRVNDAIKQSLVNIKPPVTRLQDLGEDPNSVVASYVEKSFENRFCLNNNILQIVIAGLNPTGDYEAHIDEEFYVELTFDRQSPFRLFSRMNPTDNKYHIYVQETEEYKRTYTPRQVFKIKIDRRDYDNGNKWY